jgi:dienelactone hydrolase
MEMQMRGFTATRATYAAAIVLLAWTLAPLAHAQGGPQAPLNPIVFVHGASGSGSQFESQALRFASNGYPQSFIRVVEYNSAAIQTILPEVLARIDAAIAELQAQTGRPQVELVGHSLGTFVSRQYLATPARAARVAHYVNADGGGANALPGGVPTLALFAGAARAVQPQFVGARNVTLPEQEHIQAVTSQEAFVEMFRFFNGREPGSAEIVPQTGPFPVSGRAVLFPQNTGAGADTMVVVFELNPATGRPASIVSGLAVPQAVLPVNANGDFGPFQASPGVQYELMLVRPNAMPHRFFFEPFLRSDNLVRLNTSLPGQGLDAQLAPNRSDASSGVVISRNKEFRGDRGVALDDVISINGTNVINEVTAPSGFVGSPAALFLLDLGADGVSNLRTRPLMGGFLSGADLFIPADPPGTITIDIVPRGNVGARRTLRIPNGRSTEQRMSVQLNDFEETLDSINARQGLGALLAVLLQLFQLLQLLQQLGR